jgi:hypothetical protein
MFSYKYLKEMFFIHFTNLNLLETFSHLHTKTMNRLQTASLNMILWFNTIKELSCWQIISPDYHHCNYPFQLDLIQLQLQDQQLQAMRSWPPSITKQEIETLASLAPNIFLDKNKLVWIRLEDFQYPRTAVWLP